MPQPAVVNAFTVDVEDYFQVQAFAHTVNRADWNSMESRVEKNTMRVLEVMAQHGVRGTFFVLGWVAERVPGLVKELQRAGHEVACHGLTHQLVFTQSPELFREETTRAKHLLEDLSGTKVRGYRAATYSITRSSLWALDILQELGFEYDSSIFPIHHDTYGIPSAPRFAYKVNDGPLLEVPLTTMQMGSYRMPCGGGGYFRILPYGLFRWALKRVNDRDQQAAIFYCHPWEIDPGQPRFENAPLKSKFRHYFNLDITEKRLHRLLSDFKWGRMDEIFGLAA